MQTSKNISAEELAKLFYSYRDMLASDFGLQSSGGCISWEEILPEHRNLMIASARLVLRELAEREFIAGNRKPTHRKSAADSSRILKMQKTAFTRIM
jgi:hypothetical protein